MNIFSSHCAQHSLWRCPVRSKLAHCWENSKNLSGEHSYFARIQTTSIHISSTITLSLHLTIAVWLQKHPNQGSYILLRLMRELSLLECKHRLGRIQHSLPTRHHCSKSKAFFDYSFFLESVTILFLVHTLIGWLVWPTALCLLVPLAGFGCWQ